VKTPGFRNFFSQKTPLGRFTIQTMIEYESLKKSNAFFEAEMKTVFEEFLQSGWYILGSGLKNFEESFAAYTSAKHCIGVGNGLDALVLALDALNLPPASEVLVPSNAYIAAMLAVLRAGHKIKLVEPDLHTYNICPERIKEAISDKTRVIIAVHLYGKLAPMDKIMQIAEKNGLFVIEDAAQAHGAKLNGKQAGTWGHCNAFSFYPTKNLGAWGDGGAVLCDDILAQKIRCLRNYGSSEKYINTEQGYNSRLDDLQARFLSVKLRFLDSITEKKRGFAQYYFEHLKSDFILPQRDENYFDVYHIFNIRHQKRDELRAYLLKNNIKTEIHYPLAPHKQKALSELFEGEKFPVSEEIHATTLSLPISFGHELHEIQKVAEVLNNF
jgi:dTDP-4-amino-4,6-dideoxygalactose transaminase